MGASYRLSSSNLFLRSAGKNRVSVVKLIKDHVESGVVGKEDWEVMETIGINMSCDSLEICDYNIVEGEEFKRLALNLCMSRFWVNREGDCFILSMGITSMFYKINQLFDWSAYGVENVVKEKYDQDLKAKGEDKEKEIGKLQEKFDELVKAKGYEISKLQEELKNKEKDIFNLQLRFDESVKAMETEISKLKAEHDRCLQGKRDESKVKDKEIVELRKELGNKKLEISTSGEEIKNKDKRITKLEEKFEKLVAKQDYSDFIRNERSLEKSCFQRQTRHQTHHPDFSSNSIITLTPVYVYGRYKFPKDVKVYVDNGNSFDEKYWWCLKVQDENTYEESWLAHYRGHCDAVDKFNKQILNGGKLYDVRIPHREQASCSASVQFRVALLRGRGFVYGFLYK